jgi:Holliday junction DNA helicase RuvA
MIAYLAGKIVEKHPTRIIVDVGGVGYEVFIPLSSYDRLPGTGEQCTVLTHHHVREDSQVLFGFMTEGERAMFKLLLGTTGIGPKLALSALSGLSVTDLKSAIAVGDTKCLSSISGIGKKVAERLVVELRDKVSDGGVFASLPGAEGVGDSLSRDAMLALVALGYKQDQARKMVMDVVKSGKDAGTVEDMVRRALGT